MSTPCQTCLPIDCTKIIGVSQDIAEFGNGGYTFWNDSYTFVVNCPAGYNCSNGTWPRIITIPEGEIEINIPPNPGYVSIICRGKTLTTQIPVGATSTQIQNAIQSLLQDCAEQYAIYTARNTAPVPHSNSVVGGLFRYYTNTDLIEAGCLNGMPDSNQTNMSITTRISVINGIVTVQPSTDYITENPNKLTTDDKNIYCPIGVPDGLHSSSDEVEAIACANHKALNYAKQKHAELVADGTIVCAPNPFLLWNWSNVIQVNNGAASGTILGGADATHGNRAVSATVNGLPLWPAVTQKTPPFGVGYNTNTTGVNLKCRMIVVETYSDGGNYACLVGGGRTDLVWASGGTPIVPPALALVAPASGTYLFDWPINGQISVSISNAPACAGQYINRDVRFEAYDIY